MKTSNKILCSLLMILFISMVTIDFTLNNAYAKISLDDPFKNYEHIAVRPFKYLVIRGGNGYAIEIKQADTAGMVVMKSRRGFLSTAYHQDTLLVQFNVAGTNQNQLPESLPKGLIITSPAIAVIYAAGTSNIVQGWKADRLKLVLAGNASADISHMNINGFTAIGSENSLFRFQSGNQLKSLDLRIKDNSSAYLNDVSYAAFNPVVLNQAQLIFNAASAGKLKKP